MKPVLGITTMNQTRSLCLAFHFLTCLTMLLTLTCAASGDEIRLSALDLGAASQGWGNPAADRTVGGHSLAIGGRTFGHGFGTHADSRLVLDLKGSARRFTAWVGVDDETNGGGSVEFRVIADGKTLWSSGVMRGKQPAKEVDVDVSGIKKLILQVGDTGDGIDHDHADWAGATITYEGAKPEVQQYHEPVFVLTPKPSAKPRINGAKVVGVRPGSPFLYAIAATGERPLRLPGRGTAGRAAARSGHRHHHRQRRRPRRVPREGVRDQLPRCGQPRPAHRRRRPPGAHAPDGLELVELLRRAP